MFVFYISVCIWERLKETIISKFVKNMSWLKNFILYFSGIIRPGVQKTIVAYIQKDKEKYLSSKTMLNKKAYINIHKHL